jgi:hypothetical protein
MVTDMTNLTDNADKFLSLGPDLFGRIAGYRFYECPIYGDETTLKAITPDGRLISTSCLEWDKEELQDWIDSIK